MELRVVRQNGESDRGDCSVSSLQLGIASYPRVPVPELTAK